MDISGSVNVPRMCMRLFSVTYRITFPKATSAEINAFLHHTNYGDLTFRFFSPSQISENETRIGLTRKRGSTTTAYQALLPRDKDNRWIFWNMCIPCPILPHYVFNTIQYILEIRIAYIVDDTSLIAELQQQ